MRRLAFKEYLKKQQALDEHAINEIVKELWNLPEREYQYCAIELLGYYKKVWQTSTINLIEYCIINKSWWDTVDFIASACTGIYFKKFTPQIISVTESWNQSENIWLQRSSLLFQKDYKKDTNTQILAEYILNLASSKEFFVQKAIGWILREYAKTNPNWVINFVNENKLATLSKKEAMKHLG